MSDRKQSRRQFFGAPAGGGGGGRRPAGPLDEAGKQAVRDAWDQFMKPYVRE